jgi:hypothetical protein
MNGNVREDTLRLLHYGVLDALVLVVEAPARGPAKDLAEVVAGAVSRTPEIESLYSAFVVGP